MESNWNVRFPEDNGSPDRRKVKYEADHTLREIISGLAWLISALDHSLPYGFKGRKATSFAGRLQSLKANEIQCHATAIADALNSIGAGVAEGYWPSLANPSGTPDDPWRISLLNDEAERVRQDVAEALGVLSPPEYQGIIKYDDFTIGYSVEAIARYITLMHDALERFSSKLSSVLGDTEESMPEIRELRARWEDAARKLEDILVNLKISLSNSIEQMRQVDAENA